MRAILNVLFLLLIPCIWASSQAKIPNRVYQAHTRTCHYIGTTETDYVMMIYRDSTIAVIIYQSSYKDNYTSVLRKEFSGIFTNRQDTLAITYRSQEVSLYDSICNKTRLDQVITMRFVYPPPVFRMSASDLRPLTSAFPNLSRSTFTKVTEMETRCRYKGFKHIIGNLILRRRLAPFLH